MAAGIGSSRKWMDGWMYFKINFCLCALPWSPVEGDTVCKNIREAPVEEEGVGLERNPTLINFLSINLSLCLCGHSSLVTGQTGSASTMNY